MGDRRRTEHRRPLRHRSRQRPRAEVQRRRRLHRRLRIAGQGSGELSLPKGVAVSASGQIYIADTGNNRVEEWAAPKSSSEPPTFLTSFTPEKIEGSFKEPEALAVGPKEELWMADSGHDRMIEFNSKREYVTQFGSEGTEAGQFKGIRGIATNAAGDVYATDYGNGRVQEFSPEGHYLRTLEASRGTGTDQFSAPAGVAVEPSSGDVWVLNSNGVLLQEFSPEGKYLTGFGTAEAYADPAGLAISGGNLM